jgi:hypothetical protein
MMAGWLVYGFFALIALGLILPPFALRVLTKGRISSRNPYAL